MVDSGVCEGCDVAVIPAVVSRVLSVIGGAADDLVVLSGDV